MILGFELGDLLVLIAISLAICITVCTLAMEASVLFTPAFVFLFPFIIQGFPKVSANEAIGLAITIEFFGYTSSVLGYWFRRQIDLGLALRVLSVTVPLAILGRLGAYFIPEEGLLIIFGLVLIALAAIIFRAYQGEIRHTCLLCGDSLMAMKFGDSMGPNGPGSDSTLAGHFPGGKPTLVKRTAFDKIDRLILSKAGAFAGLIGVAIGEISNTFLSVRKRVPIKVSTGTSALVLHVTILAALAANLAVLQSDLPIFDAKEIVIPWRIAFILAPVVVMGGQIGAFINSRLQDKTLIQLLVSAYLAVGVFVLLNIVRGQ